MHVTADDVNFCDCLECVYVKYKSRASTACECLINTWVFAGYNMAVDSVRHGFLCNNIDSSFG